MEVATDLGDELLPATAEIEDVRGVGEVGGDAELDCCYGEGYIDGRWLSIGSVSEASKFEDGCYVGDFVYRLGQI